MSLRVIAGSAKGCRLKRVPGNSTRPIMDRVKEALFSIIGREVIGATFLDLYAGTGSVSIEALSRGAAQAVLVERDRFAIQTIKANLASTKLGDNAIVRRADVFAFLKRQPDQIYDYIYIAPPQYKDLWINTLKALDTNPAWVSDTTQIIVQIDPKERSQPIIFDHLEEIDQRQYGKTQLVFFTHKSPAAQEETQ
jgi:16S rRNA (guanine966-N2)-methyltransferase